MMNVDELITPGEKAGLSAYNIASKAFARASRKQREAAALLFELAAEKADQEFADGIKSPNQAMNYRARAAYHRFDLGQIEAALPVLIEVCAYDWEGNGLPHDRHMVEWAYTYRLQAVKDDPEAFRELFREAQEKIRTLGWEFPRIHPKQESLLEMALELRETELVRYLIERIKSRKPISRAIRGRIKVIETEL